MSGSCRWIADTHEFVEDVQFLGLRQLTHVMIHEHGEHLGVEPLLMTTAHHWRLRQRHHAEARVNAQQTSAANHTRNSIHVHMINSNIAISVLHVR